MRNTITRTFNTVSAHALIYVDGKVTESIINVPRNCDTTDKAEKYIRRTNSCTGKLIGVDKMDITSGLYGMEESDFLIHAKPVEARSKETRNMISKTVDTLVGELVYMDMSDRQVKTRPVTIPKNYEKRLDKYAQSCAKSGEKGVTIENVKTVSALYVMSESDFLKYAKPMLDHQHYKD